MKSGKTKKLQVALIKKAKKIYCTVKSLLALVTLMTNSKDV
jgi:hypothetical protein